VEGVMETSQADRTCRRKTVLIALSILFAILLISSVLASNLLFVESAPCSFEQGKNISIDQAQAIFRQSSRNEDLYVLLVALCYQVQTNSNNDYSDILVQYGKELYARTRAGTLDLEKIGDPEQTTAMLQLLSLYDVNSKS
jgi:hypothetical protein